MGTSDSGEWATEYLGPHAIRFLDVSPTLAWALGGTALLRITDGGRKWTDVCSVNNPSQKDAVDFVSVHTGYGLIGRMNAQGSVPLMRTQNGSGLHPEFRPQLSHFQERTAGGLSYLSGRSMCALNIPATPDSLGLSR